MKHLPVPILVFITVFFASLGFTGFVLSARPNTPQPTPILLIPVSSPTPTPTPDPLAPINILIMGYGGGTHDGGSLTDTIMVLHVIPREERVVLVTIPRDLWVSLPLKEVETVPSKINSAYAIGVDHKNYPNKPKEFLGNDGGRKLASYAVTQVTGLPIDHAVSISFSGFLKAVSLLEPLSVEVPQTFTDNFYPIEGKESDSCEKSDEDIKLLTSTMSGFLLEKEFPCRFETISYTRGRQQLTAVEALKFVRSRHSDVAGGDFNRSLRQSALIDAIKKRLTSPSMISKIIPVAQTVLQSIDTDINISDIPELIGLYQNVGSYNMTTISLTEDTVLKSAIGPQNQYILIPKDGEFNWSSIHSFIQTAIQTNGLPTSSPSSTSTPTRGTTREP